MPPEGARAAFFKISRRRASGTGSGKKARVEIIPLIDVIFFLLATFVLFTLSLDRIEAIKVQFPKGGEPRPEPTMVYIQTSEGDMLYWKQGNDGTPELISLTELPARLDEYKHRVIRPKVLVRGDGKAKFGKAVAVLDDVRSSGIAEVSVETLTSRTGN